ncbi:ROK family protein [Vibrio quintilis]|uniref:N-acetylglucosamine repressor n=1 Tax=Vibrio quintilis TaxID=1117707 RepID=A0A1M7YQJ4_9VIBR|nr:ROK family protein [Vibrio quintilis]SHO54923.1 N-acetylglucosamine repressor [Vibrio quintilis]
MAKRKERVTNHEQLKLVNAALVYQLIDLDGPVSRVSIAQRSALAPASVTNITRQLLDHHLISEVAQQASTGGRPAISLTTQKSSFHFVSCRLGRDMIQCAAMDLSGQSLFEQQTDIEEHDKQGIVHTLFEQIQQIIDRFPQKRFIAIAVTMAGLVDPASGIIHYSPNHSISGLKLSEVLKDFSLPVYIGNDIRARALSEFYLGAAQQCDDFILVSIHNGVGAGIISDGQLLLGKHRPVGEIGHVQIDPFGKQCHCGSFGCLETVVSNPAIIEQTRELLERGHPSCLAAEPLTIESICHAATQGDAVATHIMEQAAKSLGQVLGMLVNVFNPEKILLSGEIAQSSPVLFPLLMQQIKRQTLPSFSGNLTLDRATFQHQDTIGGYALIKRALHESDLLRHIMQAQ